MENHDDITRIFWVLQLKIITKTKLHKQPYSQLQLQVATVIGSLMDNFLFPTKFIMKIYLPVEHATHFLSFCSGLHT